VRRQVAPHRPAHRQPDIGVDVDLADAVADAFPDFLDGTP